MRSNAKIALKNLRGEIIETSRKAVHLHGIDEYHEQVHNARYKLYEIAKKDINSDLFHELKADQEIKKLANQLFPLSCELGIEEECNIASNLLKTPNLTFDDIYKNYYGEIYQSLMTDEMAYLESLPNISMSEEKIVYIGGGALPIPAMLMAQKYGCKITIIDPHKRSCELATALLKKINLDHLISVEQSFGEAYDYDHISIAFLANWITDKKNIFNQLSQYSNIKFCIFRSAAELSPSFVINDMIETCFVCKCGFKLAHKTKKQPNTSLISLIFTHKCNHNRQAISSQKQPSRIVSKITDLIGNTPMLLLDPQKTGLKNINLYAKLEYLNPFGSIKDRTAWGMLEPHLETIKEQKKQILELSSGNAARALQAIASSHGIKFETVSNRIRVNEMKQMLTLQGAEITPIHNISPNDAYGALNTVDEKASANSDKYFYTDQYRNPNNDGTHYRETGREILEDIKNVDFFIGAIGTAGTTAGVSKRLREKCKNIDIIGVISDKDDFIPGIRHKDEIFNVGAYNENNYTNLQAVKAHDSIQGMLELARLYGVMAGPSSGATYQASLNYLKTVDATLSETKNAVFIVCDRMEMYLSWLAERRPDLA